MKTLKNKLVSLALILIGILLTRVDNDATVLVLLSFIAIPMFFSKENWIY